MGFHDRYDSSAVRKRTLTPLNRRQRAGWIPCTRIDVLSHPKFMAMIYAGGDPGMVHGVHPTGRGVTEMCRIAGLWRVKYVETNRYR